MKGLECLLGGLQGEAERHAVGQESPAAAIRIERIFRIGQRRAPFGRPEPGALSAGLLIAGEKQDQVALGLEAGRFELEE